MKKLATVACAAFLLFGINTHARADDSCVTVKEKLDRVTAASSGWITDVIANQTGVVAQVSLQVINAQPPASTDKAESIVFFRGTNQASGETDNRVLLVTHGCVTAMYRLEPDVFEKLLGQGS